ncbi:MAG: hypothetical protein QOK39_1579, partial [Acidimicrobiaceae bacterium]|nr:hypothetical protein [Acidimicrobiaceae bacterium]
MTQAFGRVRVLHLRRWLTLIALMTVSLVGVRIGPAQATPATARTTARTTAQPATTGLLSTAFGGASATTGNGPVVRATASADLRYVAYISYATNVVRGQVDGNVAPDVFFTDRATGTTTLVSHAAGSSTMTANAASGNYGDIYLSANGKWLLFGSAATNLVAGETDDNGQNDVFLDRTGTGTVTLVSHAAAHSL